MSATNRGATREVNDFYETPEWLTKAIVPHLGSPRRILEPAVGGGAIIQVLQRAFPEAIIETGDIVTGQDFLIHQYAGLYDLIITNPPYTLALEFIKRALPLRAVGGAVVMLLRVNFLGGQKRACWLRENTPSIYVTPRRPSFSGKGTDATEYCWAVWQAFAIPTIKILQTETGKYALPESRSFAG